MICIVSCVIFFFFKQKTAYEMRISDWSSDVCSSDLHHPGGRADGIDPVRVAVRRRTILPDTAANAGSCQPECSFVFVRHRPPHGTGKDHSSAASSHQRSAEHRSEERRGGKECVSKCRYRWSQCH